jgi:hypothetical protein
MSRQPGVWEHELGLGVIVQVLAAACFRAMELITILNRCHRFHGFVYQHASVQIRRVSRSPCVRARVPGRFVRAAISPPPDTTKLLRYFADRRVWLVEPDAPQVRIAPYDAGLPPDPPFAFVKLGTEGIQVLRNPEEVRQKVGEHAGAERLSSDSWNAYFTSVTGVEAPDPAHGCFPSGDRGRAVSLDEWFGWLKSQR